MDATTDISAPTIIEATSTTIAIYATIDEYAERLRVSRGTVFSWLKRGLPSFKAGAARRIVIIKADRWLEAGGADLTRKSTRSPRRTK